MGVPDEELTAFYDGWDAAVAALRRLAASRVDEDETRAELETIQRLEGRLASAMQQAWDEFCGDTGNHPDCFWREGRKMYADFDRGNYARMVAAAFARRSEPSPEPAK